MPVNTAAGSKLSIGTKAAATDSTSYTADTYAEIGEIGNIGEFGDEVSSASFVALANRRARKFKGTYDAGDLQITVGFDSGDAGQVALNAALKDEGSDDYNFKVEFEDGDVFYFSGKVMSRRISVGAADDIVKANINIAISTAVLEIPAA